ncbi:MAG: hypothetical protein MUC48_16350 [Leptolyngbya sp. Prado105]|jgi:hypothetical protein|nr:hypothetical protein [Leptolyngbya sp. Prado105]
MSGTTLTQITIALGLTASIATFKLCDQTPIPPGSPPRYSISMSQQDAYWLGRTSLARFWYK